MIDKIINIAFKITMLFVMFLGVGMSFIQNEQYRQVCSDFGLFCIIYFLYETRKKRNNER